MKLSLITNQATFDATTAHFTSADRKADTENYFAWIISSCDRYLAEGDVQFLNNVTLSARNMGFIRLARQATDVVAAHTFGKKEYIGKAAKATLKDNRENRDKILEKIEGILLSYLEVKAAKVAEVKTPEQVVTEFSELVARRTVKLEAEGFTREQVATLLRSIADELVAQPDH